MAGFSAFGQAANAANFTFQGTFEVDNEIAVFDFEISAISTVIIRTLGYAGGSFLDGSTVASGGLDPALLLFAEDGSFISRNEDFVSANADPETGARADAAVRGLDLAPGVYTAVMTQYDNINVGATLAEGFLYDSEPNYTPEIQKSPGGTYFCDPGTYFCDYYVYSTPEGPKSYVRSGDWAVEIIGVDAASQRGVASIPTPAALPLLASALLGAAAVFRSRRKRAD